jgi:hypothetical protein
MGFFGLTPQWRDGKPAAPQPRHLALVDIDEAHAKVADIVAVWRSTSQWVDAPPFSGGVWDSWPKRIADGLAFMRSEAAVVKAYLRQEAAGV